MRTPTRLAVARGAAFASLLLLAGCGPRTHVAPLQRPGEDRFDVITSFEIHGGKAVHRQETPLPPGAYRFGLFVRRGPGLRPLPGVRLKIHPELLRRIQLGPSTATEEVFVTFADTMRIPRFETLSAWGSFTPADTASKLSAAKLLAAQLLTARSAQRDSDSTAVTTRFGAVVQGDAFWLTRALVIRVLRDSLRSLANSKDVVFVRPTGPLEPPPQMNGSALDDPEKVRLWVGADPYYIPELQGGVLALLDTGVDTDHEMLGQSGQFGMLADLVQLEADGSPTALGIDSDMSPGAGHGTMSAGIIAGRKATDSKGHGLTQIPIDSYRIYAASTNYLNAEPGLDGPALSHALETTFLSFGGVITVEAQAEEPEDGGISLAADQAFDGGAVIVAANGNIDGGDATPDVRAPANARRVLGIGAYSVRYGDTAVEQIPGPTGDLRIKPDLQAPTGYETASRGTYTSYSGHSGTSGATAVAGGAAALFRNLLAGEGDSVDPGHVYAGLIAAAYAPVPYEKNLNGAGRLYLPDNCWYWMVKLSLSQGEYVDVPLDATGLPLTRIAAGIWWPERAKWLNGVTLDTHSEIALTLKAADAGESPTATGQEKESVFQRASFQVAAPVTGLTAQVSARTVRDGPQTVYLVVLAYGSAVP